MKCVDALVALAIVLLFAPILSSQFLRADETWRKSICILREISETKERINAIEERYGKHEVFSEMSGFRIGKTLVKNAENRDAIFFSFDGRELHWILGR
jgi:hypothetical protein